MKNLANLNSTEWCDIVFEGKNKAYGAFELRQSSWKRYLIAFGVIVLGVIFLSFLPQIIANVNARNASIKTEIDGDYTITQIEHKQEDLIAEALPPEVPEPPKYIKMDKFVVMNIVEDDQVTDEDDAPKGMDELVNSKGVIGSFNVEDGSTDPDAVRKEFESLVTGEGTGKGAEEVPQILVTAEFMPQFPGGEAEMYKFIKDNLRYPAIEQEMGNHGRVTIRFVVSKTGEISNIQVVKGVSPGCDKEAMRVIKSMPKWIPGKQHGVPVPVYFNLPILFQLK
ncbi:MAG: energy transducer TonB [Dysgonomonas sp.]